ncbi:MAG: DUF4345 family protein [Marmoricola sp.]
MNAAALVVAVGFAGMGLAALVRPAFIWAPFGVEPTTPESRSEVRAVYGGFGLALAGLLVATDDSSLRDGVLVTVAASLFGMAAGRVVSALLEPRTLLRSPGFFLVVEVALATLTLAAR